MGNFELPDSVMSRLSEEEKESIKTILKQKEEITKLMVELDREKQKNKHLEEGNRNLEENKKKLEEKLESALDIANRPWFSFLTISYSFKNVTKVFYGKRIEDKIVGNKIINSTLNALTTTHEMSA